MTTQPSSNSVCIYCPPNWAGGMPRAVIRAWHEAGHPNLHRRIKRKQDIASKLSKEKSE